MNALTRDRRSAPGRTRPRPARRSACADRRTGIARASGARTAPRSRPPSAAGTAQPDDVVDGGPGVDVLIGDAHAVAARATACIADQGEQRRRRILELTLRSKKTSRVDRRALRRRGSGRARSPSPPRNRRCPCRAARRGCAAARSPCARPGDASQIRPLSTSALNSRKSARPRVSAADEGMPWDVWLMASVAHGAAAHGRAPRWARAYGAGLLATSAPRISAARIMRPPNSQADTIVRDSDGRRQAGASGSTITGSARAHAAPHQPARRRVVGQRPAVRRDRAPQGSSSKR